MITCTNCGECVDTGCFCPAKVAKSKPVDGGNVWFAEPEKVQFSAIEHYAIGIFVTSLIIASIAMMAGAIGWFYQTIFN